MAVAAIAAACLGGLLLIQVATDVGSPTAWILKSTTLWIVVMAIAAVMFQRAWGRMRAQGIDPRATIFNRLPDE